MDDAMLKETTKDGSAYPVIETPTKSHDLVRERRDQLIEAAISAFDDKGFHKTTVRDIGRLSGLTQGTIYNYVRSKEDILYLVCDRIVTEYIESVRDAITSDGNPVSRIRKAVEGIASVMSIRRRGILLLYHESHNLDHDARRDIVRRVAEFILIFDELFHEAGREGALSARHVGSLANMATFLPTIFALRNWGFPSDRSEAELIGDLVEFIMRGLGLPSEAPVSST